MLHLLGDQGCSSQNPLPLGRRVRGGGQVLLLHGQPIGMRHRLHRRAPLDAQLHVQLIRSSNELLVGAALKVANTWDAALLPHNRDYYERRKYGGVVSSDTRSPAAPIRLTLCAAMQHDNGWDQAIDRRAQAVRWSNACRPRQPSREARGRQPPVALYIVSSDKEVT